jgi:predicted transposase/invertase (TIGR01784 family)
MLAPLDNETVFKAAFSDKEVFVRFVKDIAGIDIEVDKIETEKKFQLKAGDIDIALDIFAESTDHRVIVEIQHIDYDYNFDRFLHSFMMAVAQLQRSAQEHEIDRTVYTIVVLTTPFKPDEKKYCGVRIEDLISSLDPRNLQDKIVPIYGHKLIFLNHHYRNNNTPANYRDWLDLFYESIHNPEDFHVNLENNGIRRAVELIEFEKLTPPQRHQLKVNTRKKVVRWLKWEKGRKEGEQNAMLKAAKNMKMKGTDTDFIRELTGLSKEEIEKI